MMPSRASTPREGSPLKFPPTSVTPVTRWRPPRTTYESKYTAPSPSRPSARTARRQDESPLCHEARRLSEEQEQRHVWLELLELRSINRTLGQRHLQDQREVSELTKQREQLSRKNAGLRLELEEATISLKRLQLEESRLSELLAKQAALLAREREIRRAEKELKQLRRSLRGTSKAPARSKSRDDSTKNGAGQNKNNDSSSSRISNNNRSSSSSSNSRDKNIEGASSLPPSSVHGMDADLLLLPELVEQVRSSLTGTVGRWVKDMQAACSPKLRRALVLPWLLHKLFYLCADLIDTRREELETLFMGGFVDNGDDLGDGGTMEDEVEVATMDADAADFMRRHLRRHHRTLFPLTGVSLKVAMYNITMDLACSMVDSDQWDPSAKDPDAVRAALAASGLEKIIDEYLHILVFCCLQHPAVTFTDDLGEVEWFDPDMHAEPIDGESSKGWCIVVFPGLSVTATDGEWAGQAKVVGKRFVLRKKGHVLRAAGITGERGGDARRRGQCGPAPDHS